MNKIIIIMGCLASGKSYLYEMIKKQMKLVGFNKDQLKIEIGGELKEIIDGRHVLGNMAFECLINKLEQCMKEGINIIIEGAFSNSNMKGKENEQIKIKEITQKYGYSALVFNLKGNMKVLFQRFVERENSDERNPLLHVGNNVYNYKLYKLINENLCECLFEENVIQIDTTDFSKVDYFTYLEEVDKFLSEEID